MSRKVHILGANGFGKTCIGLKELSRILAENGQEAIVNIDIESSMEDLQRQLDALDKPKLTEVHKLVERHKIESNFIDRETPYEREQKRLQRRHWRRKK